MQGKNSDLWLVVCGLWVVFSEPSPRPLLRHTGVGRYLVSLCRGSISFFSKEGMAGSTRLGSLVSSHCHGIVSGSNAEISAYAGMTVH